MNKEPAIKVIAMPKDANGEGDIFGGWILSMMDLAAYIPARQLAKQRVVTVAMDNVQFHLPVYIGDCFECYAEVEKVGNTSIRVKVDAYVERKDSGLKEKVTEGHFTYVAIDSNRKPVKVKP